MQVHVEKVEPIVGFLDRFLSTERVEVKCSGGITSDSPKFYTYINQISNIYFSSPEFSANVNSIHSFLILMHSDLSADIYINDFKVIAEIRLKRNLEVGTLVRGNDIADILESRIPDIDIQDSDSVICCLKVGWKFLLYFNFLSEGRRFDIVSMQTELGRLYRYLSFQYVYHTLESKDCFKEMIDDGWFPFVEILGKDYKELAAMYQNGKSTSDHAVKALLDKFDESRLREMTDKWWENLLFQGKRDLLQAGIDAFLKGTKGDYINCIKNLYTEIEGIMRLLYFEDTGQGNRIGQEEFISHLIAVGEQTAGDANSLLLPQQFLKYLTESVFTSFNVETGTVDLSRHSAAHGVATGKDYTVERALQAILTLNQIYFYLPSPSNDAE